MTSWEAVLYLEKGHLFHGLGFGARQPSGGELVFNTGMTGYQEVFTDPSYSHQVVVMTYPHLGNTGINSQDKESSALYLKGIVARQYEPAPSSWRSEKTLHDYLNESGVPGIYDVDTREITQIVRGEGAQRAVIFPTPTSADVATVGKALLNEVPEMEGLELVSLVSCQEPYFFRPEQAGSEGLVVVYDYGVKRGILKQLQRYGFKVEVVPYDFPHQEVLAKRPKAVVLSNGPGDPERVPSAVKEIEGVLGQVPVLAICMGHQLSARALGCHTYKLKFGHHGVNHPVRDAVTGRILITSQNHGFAVRAEDLKSKEIQLGHVSLNDGTVEGFSSKAMRLMSVQFHPEASPGPNDAGSVFESFFKGFLQ